jgi:pimeloyl-ACP methyl ester carboxylesterase
LAVANAPYRTVSLLRAIHLPLFALPAVPELVFRLGGAKVVDLMFSIGWKARGVTLDPEARAEYIAAYADPVHVTAMLGYYRAAVRPRLASILTRTAPVGVPRVTAEKMLVLWGAADPVLPISVAESVVKDLGPSSVLVTIPGAGHFVIEEAPDLVLATLQEFLS